jgi:urease accessory protein
MTATAAALLLADARLPSGGHAHSQQVEAAVRAGLIADVASLAVFLEGRLRYGAGVAAAFATRACAAAVAGEDIWRVLDAELDARLPSPAQRATSRSQGRTLLRAAAPAWPSVVLAELTGTPAGPHHAIALGAVAAAAGCSPGEAALVSVYQAVTNGATAGVRLLGLDPLAVHAALADLAPAMEDVASGAAAHEATPPHELRALSAPVPDLLAEDHATWEVRLFAS